MPELGQQVFVKPSPEHVYEVVIDGARFLRSRVPSAPGRFLPAEGASLPMTNFLVDRIRAGEAIVCDPPAKDGGSL